MSSGRESSVPVSSSCVSVPAAASSSSVLPVVPFAVSSSSTSSSSSQSSSSVAVAVAAAAAAAAAASRRLLPSSSPPFPPLHHLPQFVCPGANAELGGNSSSSSGSSLLKTAVSSLGPVKVKRTRQRVDAGEPRNSYASIANFSSTRAAAVARQQQQQYHNFSFPSPFHSFATQKDRVEKIVSNMLQATAANSPSPDSGKKLEDSAPEDQLPEPGPASPPAQAEPLPPTTGQVNGCKKRKLYQPQQTAVVENGTDEELLDDDEDDVSSLADDTDDVVVEESASDLSVSKKILARADSEEKTCKPSEQSEGRIIPAERFASLKAELIENVVNAAVNAIEKTLEAVVKNAKSCKEPTLLARMLEKKETSLTNGNNNNTSSLNAGRETQPAVNGFSPVEKQSSMVQQHSHPLLHRSRDFDPHHRTNLLHFYSSHKYPVGPGTRDQVLDSGSRVNENSSPFDEDEALSLVMMPKRKRAKVTDTRRTTPPPLVPSLSTSVAIPNPSLHHPLFAAAAPAFPYSDPTRFLFGQKGVAGAHHRDLESSPHPHMRFTADQRLEMTRSGLDHGLHEQQLRQKQQQESQQQQQQQQQQQAVQAQQQSAVHSAAMAQAVSNALAAHHLSLLAAANQRGSPDSLQGFGGMYTKTGSDSGADISEDASLNDSSPYDPSLPLTSTLTPMHLRKAKLMFFYVRYPSSAVLKMFFPDIKFNKNNTAQLVKWFSNFREFFYIQMEKYARQAVAEGVQRAEDIEVPVDAELIRVLNLHYNRNNHIEAPEHFRYVVECTLREFFKSIVAGKDSEQSWKKAIYKIIARLDDNVPEYFKSPTFLDQLE